MKGDTLRVEIDDQIFLAQDIGGVSRYFVELMRQLRTRPDIDVLTPYRYVVNQHLRDLDPARFTLPPGVLRNRSRATTYLNRLHQLGSRSSTPDLIHHTYYSPQGLRRDPRGAVRVCTVYDMIPELHPEVFGATKVHQAKRRYIDEVDGILCISSTTRRDLVSLCGEQDKPVEVVPLAVDPGFGTRAVAPRINKPYMLFVGRRGSYKNFALALEALRVLAGRHRDLQLVCAGPDPFTADELASVGELRDRVHHVAPNDEELAGLYQHAAVFIFPSKYEGFGLPVLEAFSLGCPVVIAKTPALEEVAGGAAWVTAWDDAEALAGVVDRLLGDDQARRGLVAAGHRRVCDFSWAQTAEATTRFYREVLSSSR